MTALLRMPAALTEKDQHGFFEDFQWLISPHMWTVTATDSGTATVADGIGGLAPMRPSDGSVVDNDEIYLLTTNKPFTCANNKPIHFEARLAFTEANTDDANVAAGLASTVAANSIVDDGAGLLTNFDGFCIYKVDGGTVWKCITSKGTSQTISTSTTTAGGSSYQTPIIEWRPISSTLAEVHFFMDNTLTPLLDSTTLKPIVHRYDYSSSPLAMAAFVGAKNGSANNEAINVDYIGCYQKR